MNDTIPVAFHFTVAFSDDERGSTFQEISGLTSTIEVENFTEGENRFSHKLPMAFSHTNVVLKRGVVDKDSLLVAWCKEMLESSLAEPIKTKKVVIKLLDPEGSPVRSWTLSNCWPMKWEIDESDPTKSSLRIETIELAYKTIDRDT